MNNYNAKISEFFMSNTAMFNQFNAPIPESAMGDWKGKFL